MTITVTEATAEWAVKVPNPDGTHTYEIHSDRFWCEIYAAGTHTVVHREPGGDRQDAA